MANLKIPTRTLNDEFLLEDYQDDFNALNDQLTEVESKANDFKRFEANGGTIHGVIKSTDSLEVEGVGYVGHSWENAIELVNPQGGKKTRLVAKDNLDNYIAVEFDGNDGAFKPNTNGVTSLGTEQNRFGDLWLARNIEASGIGVEFVKIKSAGVRSFGINIEDEKLRVHAFDNDTWVSAPVTITKQGDAIFGGSKLDDCGYAKLPNKMLLQWGRFEQVIVPGGTHTIQITMPVEFSTQTVFCCGNVNYNILKGSDSHIEHINVSVQRYQKGKLFVKVMDVGNLDVETNFEIFWMALGY